jgi:hypothetical protein
MRQSFHYVVGLCGVVLAGCSKESDAPAPAPPPAPGSGSAQTPAPANDPSAGIHWKVVPARKPGQASTAQRCSIEGNPLKVEHNISIALDGAQHVYVSDDIGFRRYQATTDGGCQLTLDRTFGQDGWLPIPKVEPKSQRLDGGTLHFRSGGPQWSIISGGGAVIYAYDFLLGVYRIDRGKAEPVCPSIQGLTSMAVFNGTVLIGNQPLRRLSLGVPCKASDIAKSGGSIFVTGKQVWLANDKTITAIDAHGKPSEVAIVSKDSFAPGGFCNISSVSACGDKVCVVDNNCKKIAVFNVDGSFAAELNDNLFDHTPYMLTAGAGSDRGLWLGAKYHEANNYEGAIFWIPATEM